MKRAIRWMAAVGCVLGGASSLHAGVIAADTFESYMAGSQLNGQADGTDFTAPYVVTAALTSNVTIVNQTLSYSGGTVASNGGNNAVRITAAADSNNLISRAFATQKGNPVYFSFLYNTNSTAEAFIQFGLESGSAAEPNASIGVQGIAGSGGGAEGFFARVPNAGNTASASSGISANTTYLLAGRISMGTGSATYNVVDLFVNPTSLDESSPTLTASNPAGSGVGSFNNFVLRTARTDSGSLYNFDNLTIGTTYADVVPTPEPSSLGLLASATLLLLRRHRNARQR